MAVTTRTCGVIPCVINTSIQAKIPRNNWSAKSICDFIKTQLCTLALSLTLFNSARLPREAFIYGTIPYLIIYAIWLLCVSLPSSLLQLATGQLSQQDPVGVWRAVPILRGIGHLKLLTSFLCCVVYMIYLILSAAYLIWIGKGSFPLKDCSRLHLTANGYENKMTAAECFNTTFLAPVSRSPQYLGVLAILAFLLWFLLPVILFNLQKSLKALLSILTIISITIAIVLCTFLSDGAILTSMLESRFQWMQLLQPYIWQSALVQALLSTQVANGYLISAGGTVYRYSDIRWTATMLIITNVLAGWFWVLMWDSIGGKGEKDTSFAAVLILIYQSALSESRTKKWPLCAFGLVFITGVITMITLLFPIYDKLQRLSGENWRLFAIVSSATGTALTITVLSRGLEVAAALDELVIPVLSLFTTALEIVGFVFIYGWCYLKVDIEFLTGIQLPWCWIVSWWTIPFLILGITGWWLRALLENTWGQIPPLWPLVGVFIAILVFMLFIAAIAVAKEEQFNLLTKTVAAFKPSRLWGPKEPLTRYFWMSQRYKYEVQSSITDLSDAKNYHEIISNQFNDRTNSYRDSGENYFASETFYHKPANQYLKNVTIDDVGKMFVIPTKLYEDESPCPSIKKLESERFRSPNICIEKGELGGPNGCNCNRHFTLYVPHLNISDVNKPVHNPW